MKATLISFIFLVLFLSCTQSENPVEDFIYKEMKVSFKSQGKDLSKFLNTLDSIHMESGYLNSDRNYYKALKRMYSEGSLPSLGEYSNCLNSYNLTSFSLTYAANKAEKEFGSRKFKSSKFYKLQKRISQNRQKHGGSIVTGEILKIHLDLLSEDDFKQKFYRAYFLCYLYLSDYPTTI